MRYVCVCERERENDRATRGVKEVMNREGPRRSLGWRVSVSQRGITVCLDELKKSVTDLTHDVLTYSIEQSPS